jgi:hypothetical protein
MEGQSLPKLNQTANDLIPILFFKAFKRTSATNVLTHRKKEI